MLDLQCFYFIAFAINQVAFCCLLAVGVMEIEWISNMMMIMLRRRGVMLLIVVMMRKRKDFKSTNSSAYVEQKVDYVTLLKGLITWWFTLK